MKVEAFGRKFIDNEEIFVPHDRHTVLLDNAYSWNYPTCAGRHAVKENLKL